MRIAYLECFSGISGDMLLGALLHAGVSQDLLQRTVTALNIEAELRISRVDRSGISATKVDVLVNGKLADHAQRSPEDTPQHHDHSHPQVHEHSHEHQASKAAIPTSDRHSHAREHRPDHQHGRSLSEIREIIRNAELPLPARDAAVGVFELLGETEAEIHNVPLESIH